ncbi:mediator of RNA polymerase II transcription subunit 21 [Plasmodium brasilianum]|uniref:Large ribosomal subunit processing factor, putative n=2 Tax=Plasmodium (Plasmodium) TaxID=418103 RepID=A0A1D3PBV4_PLAMA|nr:large ribosomal subunit processing factor, putative [Plasmodium malariae]KAI4838385.1 mediator of RNA polymerase II transcription subunit 21 [Plasmodium brasilianum]SCN12783.1 large ribosomal subunit processing factor, putative [Plasmodium malariae]
MINNFISPQTNDPIKKLQNLLNNCLHSIIDVLSNLSYKGELKELQIVSSESSEYAHFVNLLKEWEKERKGTIEGGTQELNSVFNDKVKEDMNAKMNEDTNDKMKDEVNEGNKSDGKKEHPLYEDKENEKSYFIKSNFEVSLEEEILDRAERMNLILKIIDACIDELPDSLMIEEEKCREMKMLQKKKDDSKEELKNLYNEYNYIYNYVTSNLRDFIINMEQ